MPPTNYDKWSKFANDLHSDTDSEEEADFAKQNPEWTKKSSKFLHIPAQKYIPGGKKKLCELLQTCDDVFEPPARNQQGFTIEEKETVAKQVEAEKERNRRAQQGADAAGVDVELEDEDAATGNKKAPNKTELILQKFGWKHIASQFLPGYQAAGRERYLWRVWYDDCFLQTQNSLNPAARSLIGTQALGSFVIGCLDKETGEDVKISRKEVVDLVYKRSQGGDAERIEEEIRAHSEKMKQFESIGMDVRRLNNS